MRRAPIYLICLAALGGCFQSTVPLSPPGKSALDSRLLGTWQCASKNLDANETMTATVMRFDEQQYLLELKDSTDPKIEHYRFYPSKIGANTLWNAQELSTDLQPKSWVFVRIEFGDSVTANVSEVSDEAVHGKTQSAKLANVRARVADPTLYGEKTVCTLQAPMAVPLIN
jgi:hypothetical protein